MNKVISEDALRRAWRTEEGWLARWTCAARRPCSTPWILDIDTTIKPLYGKKGAVVFNEPGRPSHSYHTYLMAGLRLVMGVEIKVPATTPRAATPPVC